MLPNKPKLTAEQQVKHLVDKGVKFSIVSETDAARYLSANNNFFKLTAYRKNFAKYQGGPSEGKYIDLEFAQLQDLAIIDMRLRYLLMHMSLDIEHFTKVLILNRIEGAASEDGYSVVSDYRRSLSEEDRRRLDAEIERNRDNAYCGGIIEKYHGNYPVWAFIEIIPFGRLMYFCKFCGARLSDRQLEKHHYLLLPVRSLRNAVAHSNCILNDLLPSKNSGRVDFEVTKALGLIPDMSKQTQTRKMANIRVRELITLLYTHRRIVTSEGVSKNRRLELLAFKERMLRRVEYYKGNDLITSSFEFIRKVIDSWFPAV